MSNPLSVPTINGPLFRQTDPNTSKSAAGNLNITKTRDLILAAMYQHTRAIGATTVEIASALGKSRDSISPHMKPLRLLGFISNAGYTRRNPQTGNECEVWVLTSKGVERASKSKPVQAQEVKCPHCGGRL